MRTSTEAERHEARRRWWGTARAAEELGISQDHVRELIEARALRAMNVSKPGARAKEYRLRPEWVADYEERMTSGPTPAA